MCVCLTVCVCKCVSVCAMCLLLLFQMELFKYFNSVTGNRGFILKLFGVLIFIILLFALFRRHT